MINGLKNFASKVFGAAANLMRKIPILRNLLPAKTYPQKSREEIQAYHKRRNLSTAEMGAEAAAVSFPLEQVNSDWQDDGVKAISEIVRGHKSRIYDPIEELRAEIHSFINRATDDPRSDVEYRVPLIKNVLERMNGYMLQNFHNNFEVLNQTVKVDDFDVAKYLDIFFKYVTESVRLMVDTGNVVLEKVLSLKGVNDKDLAKALKINRDLTRMLAQSSLDSIIESYKMLPDFMVQDEATGETKHLKTYINEQLVDSVRIIFLASKFGLHSKQIIDTLKNKFKDLNTKDDQKLFQSLDILNNFHQATHGSLIQNPQTPNSIGEEISEVELEIIEKAFHKLIDIVLEKFYLKHQEEKGISKEEKEKKQERLRVLEFSDQNIRSFMRQIGLFEQEVYKFSQATIEDDEIWRNLGCKTDEQARIIDSIYSQLTKATDMLGEMSETSILNNELHTTNILNVMSSKHSIKHFERLILEISLLAAIDVTCTKINAKGEDESFLRHKNFQSLPWLANLYRERYNYYNRLAAQDQSRIGVVNIALEASKLGKELHRIGLFNSTNFFERYGIEKYGQNLLDSMNNLTDIGLMALNIELFSNLFSYLQAENTQTLDPITVESLKLLINYLKDNSTIYDENHNRIIAPNHPNAEAEKTYEHMKKVVGARKFLMLNTGLIIKFLQDSMGELDTKNDKKSKQNVDERNLQLASWLFYILVKFLPEKSNDIDSLKARIKVFKVLMDESFQDTQKLPRTLYPKLKRQALGLAEHTATPSKRGKNGVIKAICDDLDSKVAEVAQNQDIGMSLEDLLEAYADVEGYLRDNPKATKYARDTIREKRGINKPLMQGLKNVIPKVLPIASRRVTNFVKNQDSPELSKVTAREILKRASNLAQEVVSYNLDSDGNLVILDSDKTAIHNMTRVLRHIEYLGFLFAKQNEKLYYLRPEHFIFENDDPAAQEKIKSDLNNLRKLTQAEVLLRLDRNYRTEEEAFPGQFEAKNRLTEQLKKPELNYKPAFGTGIEWLSATREKNLREKSYKEDSIASNQYVHRAPETRNIRKNTRSAYSAA